MRTVLIIVGIIACVVTGVVILKTLRYYSGGELAQVDAEIRARKTSSKTEKTIRPKKKKTKKSIAEGTSTRKSSSRIARRKKPQPLDLNEFYRNIELTSIQKDYAESLVATLDDQYAKMQDELIKLRKECEQKLLSFIDESKQKSLSASDYKNIPLDKLYKEIITPNLDPEKRQEAEAIYQEFVKTRNEIRQKQRESKKLTTRMLLSLLTPEQKQVFRREHPGKKTLPKETQISPTP